MATEPSNGLVYYMIDAEAWQALVDDPTTPWPTDTLKNDFSYGSDDWAPWIMAPYGAIDDEEYDWLEDMGFEIKARAFRPSNQPSYLG